MRNTLLMASGAVVAILLVVHSGVANATLRFLLTGAIPGTTYSLSPIIMLALMATSIWLSIAAVSQKVARYHLSTSHRTKLIHRSVNIPELRQHKAKS